VGNGLELVGTEYRLASAIPARGTENVSIDAMPALQQTGTVNTGGSITADYPLAVSRRYTIHGEVWVKDGSDTVLYCKSLTVKAYRKSTGNALIAVESVLDDFFPAANFTFTVSVSTTNIRFTLANASGTNRLYNLTLGGISMDLP
jgi:hypothetical protein